MIIKIIMIKIIIITIIIILLFIQKEVSQSYISYKLFIHLINKNQ